MTKQTADSGNPIERLLQDRTQFVNWLARLNSPGEGPASVPESVRARVRADYERRLDAVLLELRTHVTQIEEQVGDLTARHGALTHREAEQQEQLAEAEVRHLVGEYDERLWDGIRAERMKVIAQVREELAQTSAEITRLSEVLATIRAPVPHEAEPAPPAPPPVSVSAPRPPVRTPEPPPARPEPEPPVVRPAAAAAPQAQAEIPFKPAAAPRPQPAPAPKPPQKKEEAPGRTLWFPSGKPSDAPAPGGKVDELAFIKSIDAPPASTTPPKSRPSGGFIKADNALTPAPEPAPPPPKPAAPPPVETTKERPSQSAGQKTLKCGECGTLNRPTEWYCERCGAELAAL